MRRRRDEDENEDDEQGPEPRFAASSGAVLPFHLEEKPSQHRTGKESSEGRKAR